MRISAFEKFCFKGEGMDEDRRTQIVPLLRTGELSIGLSRPGYLLSLPIQKRWQKELEVPWDEPERERAGVAPGEGVGTCGIPIRAARDAASILPRMLRSHPKSNHASLAKKL